MDPKPNLNQNIEQNEKLELSVVPIFRANDLYEAMFPEIKPLFAKGEELDMSSVQKLIDSIVSNKNKSVVIDDTCREALYHVELENLPKEFGLTELPTINGGFDFNAFSELLKKHYNIDFSAWDTIDQKIKELLDYKFSPELVKGLIDIAKRKNKNIQQILILTDSLADHVGDFPRENVLSVIRDEVRKEFGKDAKVVSTIEDLNDGDLAIVDRHNNLISHLKFDISHPKQVSILPLETEIFNNQENLKENVLDDNMDFIRKLRKIFEKK